MSRTDAVAGDDLLSLIGLPAHADMVQASLNTLAHRMQPELDPDDDDSLVDWVTVNELGLEYGFEDEAYLYALDPALRRVGPLVLSQLYFYGETPNTMPFPFPLPFGLKFADDRNAVRHKLAPYEATRRSYIRDAWMARGFWITVAYRGDPGTVESVFCHLPYTPWPPLPTDAARIAEFTPEVFAEMFGRRWSNVDLMTRFAPLGFEDKLPEARSEGVADLKLRHGLELSFAPSRQVPAADQRRPDVLAFAEATLYASRELDAREWAGPLPRGLTFADTQTDLMEKIGVEPAEHEDDQLSGLAVWHFEQYTLAVLYSNLENRLLRVTIKAPGYWAASREDTEL